MIVFSCPFPKESRLWNTHTHTHASRELISPDLPAPFSCVPTETTTLKRILYFPETYSGTLLYLEQKMFVLTFIYNVNKGLSVPLGKSRAHVCDRCPHAWVFGYYNSGVPCCACHGFAALL